MELIKHLIAGALLAGSISTAAAQPDYFPLQVGNQWTLQTASSNPEILSIEVIRSRKQGDTTWYLVSGYASSPVWVRKSASGEIFALDERTRAQITRETLLAHLLPGAPVYRTALGGCDQGAQPVPLSAGYRGPNFAAEVALGITYAPGMCRDIGMTEETYASGIGMTRRSITTFRGPVTYDLVYARVNGRAVVGKSKEIVFVDDFGTGSKGWLPGFTDYNLRNGDLRMLAELRALPDNLASHRNGFYLQSMNRSDDLFMFVKKHVSSEEGLEPNHAYRIAFDIRFASNNPTGCLGVGGSPGDSVYLKAGAAADEPVAVLSGSEVRLNVDKGNQSIGGKDAGVAGTIANGTVCDDNPHPYLTVRRQYAHPTPVRTDERGSLWLLLGTDSGFEGLTGYYLESVTVRINPAVEAAATAQLR